LICGVISGPHDRYGARMAWIATLTVLLAAARYLGNDDEADEPLLAPRQKIGNASLVDLVADGAHVIAVGDVEHLRSGDDVAQR
jgi:hypothetical protein